MQCQQKMAWQLLCMQHWFLNRKHPCTMSTPKSGGYGLRSTCLSFLEILSQSVANISPTLTPVVIVHFVFASAVDGTCLTYLVATSALMLVVFRIAEFTSRSASPCAV